MLSDHCARARAFGYCDGTAAAIGIGGTPPYTFQWNCDSNSMGSTISGLCADTCDVIVLDSNGCLSDTSFVISEPVQLVFDSLVVTDASFGGCDGDVLIAVSGGTPFYTYTANGSPAPMEWCPGVYEFVVTDMNGCTISCSVVVGELVGISENIDLQCTFHPNPGDEFVEIVFSEAQGSMLMQIYSLNGRLLRTTHHSGKMIRVDRATLPAGMYQLLIDTGNGVLTERIVFK